MNNNKSSKNTSSTSKLINEKNHKLSRFADYFVICGLDYENGLEVSNFSKFSPNEIFASFLFIWIIDFFIGSISSSRFCISLFYIKKILRLKSFFRLIT